MKTSGQYLRLLKKTITRFEATVKKTKRKPKSKRGGDAATLIRMYLYGK